MYLWLNEKVAKSSISDQTPEGVVQIVVAREYARIGTGTGLRDSFDDSSLQKDAIRRGVETGLAALKEGKRVVFTCAAGLSRSVTMACLVSALWYKTSFEDYYERVVQVDPWILNPSPVRLLVEELYPGVFETRADYSRWYERSV